MMIFTKEKECSCKECKLVFVSPLHVRQHILSRHFQGPLTRCKYCGIYSKTESSLEKHVSRRHKDEKDKERTQWKITKDQAKAAQNSGRSCPSPDNPPPPPPTPAKQEPACLRYKNVISLDPDARFVKSVSDKLIRLKENPVKNVKKELRFDEAINAISPGFRCELCGETFLQKHYCLIHQYSTCLSKKGVRKTTLGTVEPVPGFQQRTNMHQ